MKNQVDDMKAATDHMTAEKVQYLTLNLTKKFVFFSFFTCQTTKENQHFNTH